MGELEIKLSNPHRVWEKIYVSDKECEKNDRKGEPSYFDFIGKKNVIHQQK